MRAILEDLRSGEIRAYDLPAPELRPGGILVQTAFSAISAGTERAKLETSEKSLLGKAMARPDLVGQVIDFARLYGLKAAYAKVKTKLDTLSPMGYSCSGTVIGVGGGVTEFQVGDRVACAGGGYANHCEVNWVPCNLAVRVPESVRLDAASLTTIGAIAAQGLRQARVAFGETVIVIGAGLVGVLTMQLARAAGCRVIALDLDEGRVAKAKSLGAQVAWLSSSSTLEVAVRDFSRYGGDAAIITAATRSAQPLELAAKLLRDRGRIVVVGDVGMGVSRPNMYHKELKLLMSRSYGPGRYDPNYEERGQDYPVGYVRWTEKRNMESFLDLLASGAIDVSALIAKRYSVDQAERAYGELRSTAAYTAIIEYLARTNEPESSQPAIVSSSPRDRLRVGCIGAGGFAGAYIFPNLKVSSVSLDAVASASGVAAESARRNFGFARTLGPRELVADPNLDAVFIATRHHSHAQYVVEALRQGKAVFVEKPLAIDRGQLHAVRQAFDEGLQQGRQPFLMVGFNRRFAPATQKMREFFAGRREPMMVHIRVNAGHLPAEHWSQQASEGGRIVGEVCHFVDWALYMISSPINSVSAYALPDGVRYNRDNLTITINFTDGSIANLLYLANGDSSVPKEYFEIFCEGAIAQMEDFRTLRLTRNRKTKRTKLVRDKGHREEIATTLRAMKAGTAAPISLHELLQVTEATFSIEDSLLGGCVQMSEPSDVSGDRHNQILTALSAGREG
jgi:predicted dehydrogenase/threonine dehydrogenase-like Zn-dependent dehydrogenase